MFEEISPDYTTKSRGRYATRRELECTDGYIENLGEESFVELEDLSCRGWDGSVEKAMAASSGMRN